jgi:hypothetical protein
MKVVSLIFFVFAFLNGSDNLVRCMDEGGLEIAFGIKDVSFYMIKQSQNVSSFSLKIYD